MSVTSFKVNQDDLLFLAIPEHNREGLVRYFEHHIEPGSFLAAVLENDLTDTFRCADETNRTASSIGALLSWLCLVVPSCAWGSPERVQAWCALRKTETENS